MFQAFFRPYYILHNLACLRTYTWGDSNIPGIVKKNYLKCLYNFETLVPFEVLPLRLDAAIPAPLAVLEILSKIFDRSAVKGRQRFAGDP